MSDCAGSSVEAEIYATDECVKFLLELVQLLDFLDLRSTFMPSTSIIYNDILHVDGKTNLADIFTKEMMDTGHFVELCDLMLHPRLTP